LRNLPREAKVFLAALGGVLLLLLLLRLAFKLLLFLLLVAAITFLTLFLSGILNHYREEGNLKRAYERTVEDFASLLRALKRELFGR